MPDYSLITVKPLSDALGAEIHGVDLSQPVFDEQFVEIRKAFYQHSVIFFYNQALDPEHQIAFAKLWGNININRFFKPVAGYPMIAEISKEPDQKQNVGSGWHTDHSYDNEPAFTSVLYAIEVPKSGGDTLFASATAAYDALPEEMKKQLSGLTARHSSQHSFGYSTTNNESSRSGRVLNPDMAIQEVVHPVVITHPGSGREGIYVNPEFTVCIENWTEEDSKQLLSYLYRHISQPQFTCRLSWQPGTLVMWDNRVTWHRALNDYHGQRRLMHRITVEGEALTKY